MKRESTTIVICIISIATSVLPAVGTINNDNAIPEREEAINNINEMYNDEPMTSPLDKEGGDNLIKNFESEFAPGEMIVRFMDDTEVYISISPGGIVTTGITSVDNLNRKYKVDSAEKIFKDSRASSLSNIYIFTFPEDIDIPSIVKEYNNDASVVYAEPNYINHICSFPNDPYFDQQWALHNTGQTGGTFDTDIDAPEAWDIEKGSSDVIIAVIDSGVDYNHEDLIDNIWINEDEIPDNGVDDDDNGYIDDVRGWDFHEDNNDIMDDLGHGTHCSGIASAITNNGIGIAGVCWNCKIMILDAFDSGGEGNYGDTAPAIVYAADNGADIISMSWSGPHSELGQNAIVYAYNQGVVLVASAGNMDSEIKNYPAAYDNVVAVAATTHTDRRWFKSSYGEWVDVAAPGANILSTIPGDSYENYSGTSMACPHVSGLAALVLSKNPSLSNEDVKTIIRYSVDRLPPSERLTIGRGRINAYEALLKGSASATAEITSPSHGGDVVGLIDIVGSAWGEEFQYYVLEYARGRCPDETSWIEFINSDSPVQDSVIGSLDTTSIGEGLYHLRLKVVCNDGIYRDTIWIIVNNKWSSVIVDDNSVVGPWYGTAEHPYMWIQDGVDGAGIGDTVYVHSGTYNEPIIVWKTINLTGENKETTVIDGGGSGQVVVRITGNWTIISGFAIRNSGEESSIVGIFVQSDYNTISGNNISLNEYLYFGIYLENCDGNTITGNNIRNYEYGIRLRYSSNNVIERNNFIENKKQASFIFSWKNTWDSNYWDNWIGFGPKLIFGRLGLFGIIPWVNFDWHPAQEPHDI